MALPPFQQLVDEHGRDVHRFLRGLVGAEHAEDCLHEALMSALIAYPALKHHRNLRAWLFTIAHHKGIDHLRRRKKEVPLEVVPETTQAEALTIDHELWSQVGELPDKQRAAVTLRFLGDLAYTDIAGIVECSEEAARQNVRAGLANLRKEYR